MSAPRPQAHCFSVADFYKMEECGALHPEARVELLDGVVHDMFPITPGHAALVDEIGELFMEKRARRYQLRIQGPLQLDEYSMVLPDVMPLKLKDDRYLYRAPPDRTPPSLSLRSPIPHSPSISTKSFPATPEPALRKSGS